MPRIIPRAEYRWKTPPPFDGDTLQLQPTGRSPGEAEAGNAGMQSSRGRPQTHEDYGAAGGADSANRTESGPFAEAIHEVALFGSLFRPELKNLDVSHVS